MAALVPAGQRRVPIVLIAIGAALTLLQAGCAGLTNTPEQDLAWSRWDACSARITGVEITRVGLDGRIFYWYDGPSARQPMLDCLREAAKDGRRLPEPIADPRPGGGGGGG